MRKQALEERKSELEQERKLLAEQKEMLAQREKQLVESEGSLTSLWQSFGDYQKQAESEIVIMRISLGVAGAGLAAGSINSLVKGDAVLGLIFGGLAILDGVIVIISL